MSNRNHHPIEYIGEMNDRIEYNNLLREYLGEEIYAKATGVTFPKAAEGEHEFVSRETIIDFINQNKKQYW